MSPSRTPLLKRLLLGRWHRGEVDELELDDELMMRFTVYLRITMGAIAFMALVLYGNDKMPDYTVWARLLPIAAVLFLWSGIILTLTMVQRQLLNWNARLVGSEGFGQICDKLSRPRPVDLIVALMLSLAIVPSLL